MCDDEDVFNDLAKDIIEVRMAEEPKEPFIWYENFGKRKLQKLKKESLA